MVLSDETITGSLSTLVHSKLNKVASSIVYLFFVANIFFKYQPVHGFMILYKYSVNPKTYFSVFLKKKNFLWINIISIFTIY